MIECLVIGFVFFIGYCVGGREKKKCGEKYTLTEGIKKGGRNESPSIPRPAERPKALRIQKRCVRSV